jgi:raffinose/stachyose/melibiose transport system substrate-binding protein
VTRNSARWIAATSAGLLALTLAACGSEENTSTNGDTVEIEFFQSKSESIDIVNELIADFEATHEGIKVKQTNTPDALTVLKSRLAKNDIPDVISVNVSNLNDVSSAGVLSDISGTEAAAAVSDENAQSYVDSLSGTDETVAVPWAVNAQVVLYNVDEFEALGLSIPQTWTEFLETAEKIQQADKTPFYFTWKDSWTAKLVVNSIAGSLQGPDFWGQLQDGSATFADSSAWQESTKKLLELKKYADGDPFGKGYDDGNAAFANGESVMYVQGTWAIPEIRATNPDLNIGAFVMPVTDQEDTNVILSGPDSIISIAKATKHAEAAQEFVDFLMSKEAQQKFSDDQFLVSVRQDVASTDTVLASLKSEWLDKGRVAMYPDSMFTGASNMAALSQQFLQDEDATAFLTGLDQDFAATGVF